MSDDELRNVIAKLSAAYAVQLPGAVAKMEELWKRIVSAELPVSQLAELAHMAHSIAGSGATFGLPEASRAARELEACIEELAQRERPPGAAEQEQVLALLAALERCAHQP